MHGDRGRSLSRHEEDPVNGRLRGTPSPQGDLTVGTKRAMENAPFEMQRARLLAFAGNDTYIDTPEL